MSRLRSLTRRQVAAIVLVLIAVSGPAVGTLAMFSPSLSNSVDVSDGVPLSAPSGPTVTLDADASVNLTNPFPETDTVRITSSVGNGSISGDGGSLAVTQLGSQAVLRNMSLNGSSITVNPNTLATYTFRGGFDSVTYGSLSADDGNTDFEYSASSSGTVTLYGLGASSGYQLVDESGTVLDLNQSTESGTLTASVPSGSKSVQLQTTTLAAPTITDIRPVGRINSVPDTIYANISDNDFPDDEVSVTASIIRENGDEREIGAATVTSDGTQLAFNMTSADKQFVSVGENTLRITATDTYGSTTTSSKPFNVPSKIYIRNTDAELLSNTTANVTFYGGPENNTVVSRTITDGVIDMRGLPVTEGFTLSVDASGYFTRAVTLQSIYEQQDIYVLSENATSIEARFVLEDSTGAWPSESTLYIERAITQNNSTRFRTVVSDSFGVEGVTTQLEEDIRYQLRIKAPDGDTAVLGSYTAQVSETVTLRPAAPGVTITSGESLAYDAFIQEDTLQVEYRDPDSLTEELTVTIHKRGDPSDTLRPSQTYYDLGNLSLSEPLNNQSGSWVVKLEGERGGESISIRLTTGGRQSNLVPELGGTWRLAAGVFILLVSAGIFSQLNVGVGAVVVAMEGGVLWWFGFLSGAATASSVALAICSAVVFNVASRR